MDMKTKKIKLQSQSFKASKHCADLPNSHMFPNTFIQTIEFIEIITISKYNIALKFEHASQYTKPIRD